MSLVVFDMDGTLIDSGAEITARVLKAFASVGLAAPSEEVIRANVGLSLPIYLSAVSGSDDPEVITALFDAYRAAAAASLPGRMPMFEGARALLERLKLRPDTQLAVALARAGRGSTRLWCRMTWLTISQACRPRIPIPPSRIRGCFFPPWTPAASDPARQ